MDRSVSRHTSAVIMALKSSPRLRVAQVCQVCPDGHRLALSNEGLIAASMVGDAGLGNVFQQRLPSTAQHMDM